MIAEPEPFSITRSERDACEVVALVGELDMEHARSVAETLERLANGARAIVVDLSDLSFIDSSGIHAILQSRPRQGEIVLVCPPGNVKRVLDVTKIDRVLPIYDTLDGALAALR